MHYRINGIKVWAWLLLTNFENNEIVVSWKKVTDPTFRQTLNAYKQKKNKNSAVEFFTKIEFTTRHSNVLMKKSFTDRAKKNCYRVSKIQPSVSSSMVCEIVAKFFRSYILPFFFMKPWRFLKFLFYIHKTSVVVEMFVLFSKVENSPFFSLGNFSY